MKQTKIKRIERDKASTLPQTTNDHYDSRPIAFTITAKDLQGKPPFEAVGGLGWFQTTQPWKPLRIAPWTQGTKMQEAEWSQWEESHSFLEKRDIRIIFH